MTKLQYYYSWELLNFFLSNYGCFSILVLTRWNYSFLLQVDHWSSWLCLYEPWQWHSSSWRIKFSKHSLLPHHLLVGPIDGNTFGNAPWNDSHRKISDKDSSNSDVFNVWKMQILWELPGDEHTNNYLYEVCSKSKLIKFATDELPVRSFEWIRN